MTVPAEIREGTRLKIAKLEQTMHRLPSVLADCTVRHFFAPGIYGREMYIPAGTSIVGKLHKHAHLNTISQGECLVVSEFGKQHIVAPYTFISEVGTKRVVHVLKDVVWTTYHENTDNTKDLAILEERIIAKEYSELEFKDSV